MEKSNIPDETNMTPSTNISTFGEIYDDVSMEFSRRYYKYEPTSKLERKRKISDYLRDIWLEFSTYGSGAIVGTAIGGIAAISAITIGGISIMPAILAMGFGFSAMALKKPINEAISRLIKKSKAKKLKYVIDIALTMTPKQIGEFFQKKFEIKNISKELSSEQALNRKKFHCIKNLDLMLYGCSLLKTLKPKDFRNKLAEYAKEKGISKNVVFHKDIMDFSETEEEKKIHGDFLSLRRECFMEFKEQKDADAIRISGNRSKDSLQYKPNASTGLKIQLCSAVASLAASTTFGLIPAISSLKAIAEKAATAGVSSIAKGIVGPTIAKPLVEKSIDLEEFGKNRKLLKNINEEYLLSFALVNKTDGEIFDIANKFMENYEYYSGQKAQKIKGLDNRIKRISRYGLGKSQKDYALLRETARKTLKKLKRTPITLYEACSVAEYIELAKKFANSDPEAQNIILVRMEEIKQDVIKSVNDSGNFSRWDGKKPDFSYFLNSYQLHMFALGKGSTAKERVNEFMTPEVSIDIGLKYKFIGQEDRAIGGGRFKFLVEEDPDINSPLYGSNIKAGTVLYIDEFTFERSVEKLRNGEIYAIEIFDKTTNKNKIVKQNLKITPRLFVRTKDDKCNCFNIDLAIYNKKNDYKKIQSEIENDLKKISKDKPIESMEKIVNKIKVLSTTIASPKDFYKPQFYIGIGIAGKIDFNTGEYQLNAILNGSPLEKEPFSKYFSSNAKLKLFGTEKQDFMVAINNLRNGKIENAIESIDGKPFQEIIKEILNKNPNMTKEQLFNMAVPVPFVNNISLSNQIIKSVEVKKKKTTAESNDIVKKTIERHQNNIAETGYTVNSIG